MMINEFRKSVRYSDFLPATIIVDKLDNQHSHVPLAGRIINISHAGACVLLPKIMFDQHDVSANLQIHIQNSGTGSLKVSARPVWLNTLYLDDAKIFKVGINFTEKLDNSDLKSINI